MCSCPIATKQSSRYALPASNPPNASMNRCPGLHRGCNKLIASGSMTVRGPTLEQQLEMTQQGTELLQSRAKDTPAARAKSQNSFILHKVVHLRTKYFHVQVCHPVRCMSTPLLFLNASLYHGGVCSIMQCTSSPLPVRSKRLPRSRPGPGGRQPREQACCDARSLSNQALRQEWPGSQPGSFWWHQARALLLCDSASPQVAKIFSCHGCGPIAWHAGMLTAGSETPS